MTHPKTELGPRQRAILYGTVALTWLSGAMWLVDKYFRRVQTDFGLQAPPTQAVWLELHGAAAMAVLVLLGSLLPVHVRLGWDRRDRRSSGGFSLLVCALLAASGWGLYYFGDPALRRGTSVFHWAVGLLFPAVIALHAWLDPGRRTARRHSTT